MKYNLIALVLAVLIAVIYFACSKVIASDQLQNFTVAFIFGLSFALLFHKKSKIVCNQHQLGQEIGNAVRSAIAKEKRQGGLLSSKHPDDHCATDIESCKKRLKDQNGFIKITWPRLTEMEVKWDKPKNEQP
ncbi:MAG: hypothetical protein GAK29_03141 [Acinetobacter bereziniae]|uniref:Uncharacterized protein n=1 Tax=Acinetobacter bereziniae TaxID=106648 RepID=A0A833PDS8_ACIBZ|nr:MAG: hypothetical protein GAK29_03141 [Acinetobacter bereziniae]